MAMFDPQMTSSAPDRQIIETNSMDKTVAVSYNIKIAESKKLIHAMDIMLETINSEWSNTITV